MKGFYYQCPNCGHKQRSLAVKSIRCYKCLKTYERSKAKKVEMERVDKAVFERFKPK